MWKQTRAGQRFATDSGTPGCNKVTYFAASIALLSLMLWEDAVALSLPPSTVFVAKDGCGRRDLWNCRRIYRSYLSSSKLVLVIGNILPIKIGCSSHITYSLLKRRRNSNEMTRRTTPIQEPANIPFDVMRHELEMKPEIWSISFIVGPNVQCWISQASITSQFHSIYIRSVKLFSRTWILTDILQSPPISIPISIEAAADVAAAAALVAVAMPDIDSMVGGWLEPWVDRTKLLFWWGLRWYSKSVAHSK